MGASPVSTGRPGSFEHFKTPLGVFARSLDNPDYRAEGTRISLGIMGYGINGMRVYEFGWQEAPKGWGNGAVSEMRLQMHVTDPGVLENTLGSMQAQVRIPRLLVRLVRLVRANSPAAPAQVLDSFNLTSDCLKNQIGLSVYPNCRR